MTEGEIHDLARTLLAKSSDALDPEEQNVLLGIRNHSPISRDAADMSDERATRGERLADKVAAIGGSWGFIIGFALVLFAWVLLNTDVLRHLGLVFDPYPFIFLNLMLSMLAAVQAPIIMMSQNRQAAKDRLAASLDFEVNLRAELEILRLHEKLDRGVVDRLDQLEARLSQLMAAMDRGTLRASTT